jgi:DNA replication and repair protein RecF
VIVRRLALTDFRNYASATLELSPDLTVVTGANGEGKTNLVEALAWLATMESFRGAPADVLVRDGAERAVLRGEVVHADGREVAIEAELPRVGRPRVQVNRQRLIRARDLVGALQVSVFSPDDLALVKGGPGERRRFLDTTLVSLHAKHHVLRSDLERILRQRNMLLKQAGGRLSPDVVTTLDVWDAKLAEVGTALGDAREALVTELEPLVGKAYADVAGVPTALNLRYAPPWRAIGLAAALAAGRAEDVRRQLTLVGPHRDELDIVLGGLPARSHASQGEQRCVALALRLAAHWAVTERIGAPPLLLLDDVFSELDPDRAHALVAHLPTGQVVVTTAGPLPPGAAPARTIVVRGGRLVDDG